MNKVFTLTIVPATKRSKELFILSALPGVPQAMVIVQYGQVLNMAKHRAADAMLLKDAEVRYNLPTFWNRLCAAFEKFRRRKDAAWLRNWIAKCRKS